ncbi:MAG: hypothetical protein ACRC1I_07490 [Pseudomonas proteolytica]|uniref:hypothetical protein n=1 Tax=Pseudomonas proteolytica TaxID=219574 RepID=UPI003F38A1E6
MTGLVLKMYLSKPLAQRGVITLLQGAWRVIYSDVAIPVLGAYLNENGVRGKLVGLGIISSNHEFSFPIGPLDPGTYVVDLYKFDREGRPDTENTLSTDVVVHAPTLPDGEITIPPVQQP